MPSRITPKPTHQPKAKTKSRPNNRALLATGLLLASTPSLATNPLLNTWKGKYQGLPPFDQVKLEHFKPALEEVMNQKRQALDAIAKNAEAPQFSNTIEPLERADIPVSRVLAVYDVWNSSMRTPEFQAIEKEMAPKLSAFRDEMMQNSALFKRVDAVYQTRMRKQLTAEQQRLVWYYETLFVLNGAKLNPEQKARVAEVNQKLATLYSEFSTNVLSDEESDGLLIQTKDGLDGLPASFVEGAALEAQKRGHKGLWFISNTRSAMEPFLTDASVRTLRERAFKIWSSRGENSNSHNNLKLISEIYKLRQEKARLLGFETFAHWQLANTMAKKPEAAMDLMMRVWKPAVAKVAEEVAEMQKIVDEEKGGFKIEPWDYRYYSEKVRKKNYDLDFNLAKPYLQLDNLREALFANAKKLYGYQFKLAKGIPVFHPGVTVYEVKNRWASTIGLWYFDPFARAGKVSGAWMTSYREQSKMDGKSVMTLVSNNCNYIPGKEGEPTLISWDDARTLFHEFGHALHGLSSNVKYPTLSGTNTPRDFVEFPSQFNENYLLTSVTLRFLKNKEGREIPPSLVMKIEKAESYGHGFSTVELLASALMDMKAHMLKEADLDPVAFEKQTLAELGMPSQIIMRHRFPHFNHVFSSEGYAAGYYSYLWSQVLDHEAFEAFKEAKSPYDPKTARRFLKEILSVGNTVDPEVSYRKFRGRDPNPDALLRKLGFTNRSHH